MKTGIYIHAGSRNHFSGVEKKIKGQIKAFSARYQMYEVVIEKEKTTILKSIMWRMPGGSWGAKYNEAFSTITKLSSETDIYFFYIRMSFFDRRYLAFLRSLRDSFPDSRIILEIPTYPYDKEYLHSSTMWPWYFKDKINRRFVAKYVDRIATVDNSSSILNIDTIKIVNGIDVSKVRPIDKDNEDPSSIRLIAVAMMQPYHGYERLISGLSTYYKNGGDRNIEFSIVGYGEESEYYKAITRHLNLDNRITFMGRLDGDELDEAYERCDIAVGSLGGYKIGINGFASIKLGEYLAKGLPVITGAKAFVFEENGDEFNLDYPNDPSEIDMDRVVDFYDGLYKGKKKSDVRKRIREYAFNTVDISKSMNNVLEYLEEN